MSEDSQRSLFHSLTQLNDRALAIAVNFSLHAATDITGFGLIGHIHEMSKASGLTAIVHAGRIPIFPGAGACVEQGLVPAGAYANRKSYTTIAHIKEEVSLALTDLLFDPQTSGGLLLAVAGQEANALADALKKAGLTGEIIGELTKGNAGQVEVEIDG